MYFQYKKIARKVYESHVIKLYQIQWNFTILNFISCNNLNNKDFMLLYRNITSFYEVAHFKLQVMIKKIDTIVHM
ncbi:uncharacterized protein LOC126888456 isoform X1 [Diabrotica virgifera virgifera]|uniref:Uncharacterized protein n=1 Tax=Diabrotica virgifera virgifera TaxID=50390 RepID=A0ABM5KRB2_DIAVI|nr:uncharacterized protein LOC126881256 isoform X1 [Diabrotica virgifera virgifera]XP_050512729.1 uncharacterized protein LOC126888456 isoform X1 [Diabrotica virgifera virgifera]